MSEDLIISLTSWKPRLKNIPIVLDSIFNQTIRPNKVVLNLAYGEIISQEISAYIIQHNIEVNYVADTKVYKKLIPTLGKYKNACIINIDDDCIYPNTMIADFVEIHNKYPEYPISGNRVVLYGMQCHCGCASLTKWEYFGEWLEKIDNDVINNCKSSDIVMTYFATKNNHPYIRSQQLYYTNLVQEELSTESYSNINIGVNGISSSINYLEKRFGIIDYDLSEYSQDKYMQKIIKEVFYDQLRQLENRHNNELLKLHNTFSCKLGMFLTAPFRWIKKKIHLRS